MRCLLVQAETPTTYWGFQHSLPFIGKRAALAPLGVATLAAHLPSRWTLRIHDLHLGPLSDADLLWADAVLVSGMMVQGESMREVLARARRLGVVTVAGGPATSTAPEAFGDATHVFIGECEGRLERLVEALEHPGSVRERVLSPEGGGWPDLSLARVPRFDLLPLARYASAAIQVSRGCPFSCEFCDVIELLGRTPRVKSAEQVLAELDELHRLGARGSLFLVDDNFIGNRRAAADLLPQLAEWQRARRFPFDLYTEASIDLAVEPRLVAAMVDAGFSAVFLGIETPNRAALQSAGKKQNLRVDPAEGVAVLTAAGLEVYAGFIVGFDGDDATIFDRQLELISQLPIPRAMIGMLCALAGTKLTARLAREGRLRGDSNGDQFDGPNFEPTMGAEQLVEGYRRLLASVYSPDAYFERCERYIAASPPARPVRRPGGFAAFWRAVWWLGIVGRRRRHFWRLLAFALRRRGLGELPRAVTLAILGEHLVRYTDEHVLPRLDRRLEELRRRRGDAAAARSPAGAAACEIIVAPEAASARPPLAAASSETARPSFAGSPPSASTSATLAPRSAPARTSPFG